MQRRSSPPVDTRRQLIAEAWRLFATRGFDTTPVQAIIDAVGVSKGTFYHHFASKEALLDAVVEEMTRQAADRLTAACEAPGAPALERINRYLEAAWQWKRVHMPLMRELMRALLRDENAVMLRKMQRRTRELAGPPLARLIEDARAEGQLHVRDPGVTAELILDVSQTLGERNARAMLEEEMTPGLMEEVERRIETAYDAMERLLGLPAGSLSRVNREDAQAAIRTFRNGPVSPAS